MTYWCINACPSQAFCHIQTLHSFYCNWFKNLALFQKKIFELFSFLYNFIKICELTFRARISISFFFLFHFLKLKSNSNLLSSSSIYIFFCVLNSSKNYLNIFLIHISSIFSMVLLAIENASSSSFSSIPPPSTSGCKNEYDVFLSFRGIDTRSNFTDHLYDRLKQEGILTFRDDERLEQGTEINSGLLRAIDESKIAIVVLSKQYASSSWCLIELAKIVECMDKKKLTVLPMFHYVDPSDVRNQRGSFV